MQHDHEFNLNAFYDGELTASESAAVQAHIDGCPACQLELVKLAELSQHVRFADQPVPRISQIEMARLKAAVLKQPVLQQNMLIHTARWLTRFAAALLIAGSAATVFVLQNSSRAASTTTSSWEEVASRPSSVLSDDSSSQTSLAEWVVTDLSRSGATR